MLTTSAGGDAAEGKDAEAKENSVGAAVFAFNVVAVAALVKAAGLLLLFVSEPPGASDGCEVDEEKESADGAAGGDEKAPDCEPESGTNAGAPALKGKADGLAKVAVVPEEPLWPPTDK